MNVDVKIRHEWQSAIPDFIGAGCESAIRLRRASANKSAIGNRESAMIRAGAAS